MLGHMSTLYSTLQPASLGKVWKLTLSCSGRTRTNSARRGKVTGLAATQMAGSAAAHGSRARAGADTLAATQELLL